MTKSTITRERIQRIIRAIDSESYDEEEIREWLTSDEIMELARMALAAMDSEPVELPLDYLHGHKDGLEWAAQLAEANHPETGDWLYDDPIELAKAIRKGTDMPPVQPVADREPDRNPVLAYADSYRDMAKQGVESVPIWSVITDLERNIAPLYRHAQPVPVVPYDFDFDRFNDVVWLECVASNPHMHSPTTSIIARVALELNKRILAGNSPVIPEGYVMVPKEPTAEMIAAAMNCDDVLFNSDDSFCVQFDNIYEAMLAAADCSIPMISDRWIPVSERMPGKGGIYLVWNGNNIGAVPLFFGSFQCVNPEQITHWRHLPAAPQEVKGE